MSIAKKLGKILFLPLDALNKILPKNPKKMFFYSNLGFRDNVKALYDYVVLNGYNDSFEIVVATDEFEQYRETSPKNVKFVSLKKGIFHFLSSKYAFYSFGKYPIMPAKGQKVVNLWHGMPLKRIGRLEAGHQKDKQNYFSHLIATSPFFAEIMKKAFGAKNEQVIITSQPRCDDMFKESKKHDGFSEFSKIIFWLPTFSSSKKLNKDDKVCYDEISPFDTQFLERVNEALKEKNALLIIKPHPMDDACIPRRAYSNLFYVTDSSIAEMGYNLYSLLSHCDLLVTDFSSIYFDFLMLDRPIAFAGLDFEEYSKNRGFVTEDARSLMPGPYIDCAEDFIEFISSALSGEDNYKEQRQKVNALVNRYNGGGCERVLKSIGINKTEEN